MMSAFYFLLLCIQACLVQNAYSQCLDRGVLGSGIGQGFGQGIGLGSGVSQLYGPNGLNFETENILQERGGYGGSGIGDVLVTGLLPVDGHTSVVGQVPVLGVVRFDGPIAAKGTVSISGACGCECQQLF